MMGYIVRESQREVMEMRKIRIIWEWYEKKQEWFYKLKLSVR